MPESDDYATELRGDAPPEPPRPFHKPVRRPQRKRNDDPFPHGPLKHEPSMTTDKRFTYFIQVVCGITATLVTTGIVWMASVSVSTARKVDVLTEKTVNIERRVEGIERRQIEEANR